MQQVIDTDEEQADLWRRVYSEIRTLLRNVSTQDKPYVSAALPNPIASLFVDSEGVIVTNTHYGSSKLIEEYDDDVMFAVYRCLV